MTDGQPDPAADPAPPDPGNEDAAQDHAVPADLLDLHVALEAHQAGLL